MSDLKGYDESHRQTKGMIKWFNTSKGFGFVHFDDGVSDAFLHASVLEQIGRIDLPEGTTVEVTVTEYVCLFCRQSTIEGLDRGE